MQWAMGKARLPRPEEAGSRAEYFRSLIVDLTQLGVMPGELRYTFEPFHALTAAERDAFVASQLRPGTTTEHELSALSRGLLDSYNPAADLFATCNAPADQDLFLFDPLIGFLLWKEGETYRNWWLGNIRDFLELESERGPVKDLLVQSRNDHFFLGKSLLLRLVGEFLQDRREYRLDPSDIPTMEVTSTADLERLADDLRSACERAPANVSLVFRGQTREHLLPDRTSLAEVVPYSYVRDHSLVPSLYRRYDGFTNDVNRFRAFVSHLLDWGLYSDMVFGDPARYFTPDGELYTPKPQPANAIASFSLAFSGASGPQRAFDDLGPYTIWEIKTPDGTVVDRYVKVFAPGRESVRRHLILQHYGAPTPLVDVTHDIRVAQWFAFNHMKIDAQGLATSHEVSAPYGDPVIYVLLVLEGLAPLVRTDELVTPEESLRPHRQAGAVLGGAGNLYRNAASRFIALKIKFASGFVPRGLPSAHDLFPRPDEDNMLRRLLEQQREPEDPAVTFPVYRFA